MIADQAQPLMAEKNGVDDVVAVVPLYQRFTKSPMYRSLCDKVAALHSTAHVVETAVEVGDVPMEPMTLGRRISSVVEFVAPSG